MKQSLGFLLLFFGLFPMFLSAQTPRKIALIVAVGDYPESSGWQKINAQNDVVLITNTLLRQGFKAGNITQVVDKDASREEILKTLRKTVKSLKPGDVFLFQFSGHGQQVADDNGDEYDGFDEAIVPYNSPMKYQKDGYQGGNLIRDEELGALLDEARKKIGPSGNVLVILDSCHSGTGTRAMAMARGTDFVMADSSYIAQQPRNKPENGWLPDALQIEKASMTAFFGATAGQLNYETKDETGQGIGSLTYAFCQKLNESGPNTTYRVLFDQVKTAMAGIAPYQTPQYEGTMDQQIFGGALLEPPSYSKISECKSRNTIRIDAGWLHGMHEGTIVGLYPAGTPSPSAAEPILKGTLSATAPYESVVKLEKPLQNKSDCSSWVYTIEKNFGPLHASIHLDLPSGDPVAVAFREKIQNLPVISEVKENPDVQIIREGNDIQLRSRGLVLEKVESQKSPGLIADRMIRKTLSWAQADYLRNLNVENDGLQLTLEVIPVELDKRTYKVKQEFTLQTKTDAQGNISFTSGDVIRVRVHNNGLRTAYFTLLDIESTNKVSVLAPNAQETPEELKVEPGKSIEIAQSFGLSPSYGKELLKLLATDQPVDLRSITQTRGVGEANNQNALSQLFAQTYFNEECMTRGGKTTSVPVENLHIDTVVFEVKE
ncbi:MAG: caspase family protein [Saprospiraceae bacterium]|nr:caspase family protein [Saprospiraceae bacterium]